MVVLLPCSLDYHVLIHFCRTSSLFQDIYYPFMQGINVNKPTNFNSNNPASNSTALTWLAIGAITLCLAVLIGAFGAHGLKEMISTTRMVTYQTAVQYHFYHGFGILFVSVLMLNLPNLTALRWVARLLLTGTVLFSGSLYALSLTGVGWLGAITPLGGLLFIGAWSLLAISLFQLKSIIRTRL